MTAPRDPLAEARAIYAVKVARFRMERLAVRYEGQEAALWATWAIENLNDALPVIEAALAPRPPETAETAFVWLVERGQPEGLRYPQWWGVTDSRTGAYGWVDSPFAADQFATRPEAEAVIAGFNTRPGHPFNARAVEHGFTRENIAVSPETADPTTYKTPEAEANAKWWAAHPEEVHRLLTKYPPLPPAPETADAGALDAAWSTRPGFAKDRPGGPRTMNGHSLASALRRRDTEVDWDAWVRSIEDDAVRAVVRDALQAVWDLGDQLDSNHTRWAALQVAERMGVPIDAHNRFSEPPRNRNEEVQAEMQAEIDRLRRDATPALDVNDLLRAVDAVIALHEKATEHRGTDEGPFCWECGAPKPCKTVTLLSFFRGFTRAAESPTPEPDGEAGS